MISGWGHRMAPAPPPAPRTFHVSLRIDQERLLAVTAAVTNGRTRGPARHGCGRCRLAPRSGRPHRTIWPITAVGWSRRSQGQCCRCRRTWEPGCCRLSLAGSPVTAAVTDVDRLVPSLDPCRVPTVSRSTTSPGPVRTGLGWRQQGGRVLLTLARFCHTGGSLAIGYHGRCNLASCACPRHVTAAPPLRPTTAAVRSAWARASGDHPAHPGYAAP